MGLILLRYGELALKGGNRRMFLRQLRRNIRDALKRHDICGELHQEYQRLYVETDQVREALNPLSRMFGLVSVSPVDEIERDIDPIVEACVEQARAIGLDSAQSFRVQARRTDKTFPYISPEINRLAGEAVVRETQARVDLSKSADVTIGVEVHRDRALVYGRVIPAPGGLPLGVEGRVVALISGGIDSPVAAWMLMKRGCGIIPVHFAQSDIEKQKALDNIEVLRRYSYGWRLKPIILSHDEVIRPTLEKLRELGEERWSCIFCKRALLQKAAEIADEYHAEGVVMGDALGQVASQTLRNMAAISYRIPSLILRPLVGLDKQEIIDLAREIGTFEISTRSEAACPFLPERPVTGGTIRQLEGIIERIEQTETPT